MKQRATVRWFDNLSQEGMIRIGERSVYVNNDPVFGYRLNAGKPYALNSGDAVIVEVYSDTTFEQISFMEVSNA